MCLIPTEALLFLYSATYLILQSAFLASFNISLKCVSWAFNELIKSLLLLVCRHSSGMKGLLFISLSSISLPLSLARIKIFLATSIPLRSIFGSGSV